MPEADSDTVSVSSQDTYLRILQRESLATHKQVSTRIEQAKIQSKEHQEFYKNQNRYVEKHFSDKNMRLRSSIPCMVERAKQRSDEEHKENLALMDAEHAKHMKWQKEKLMADTQKLQDDLDHQGILIA